MAALFDARLELTTNLTALVVPLRVYHGQLACFDAAQAATPPPPPPPPPARTPR